MEEQPSLIWFNGEVVPWNTAKVHVWSEYAVRGTSVFEGIRAYWNKDGNEYNIISLSAHLKRLFQSAKILAGNQQITKI